MQMEIQHYKLNVSIYIACVCVVETFSRENDTMHKELHTPNIYRGRRGGKKSGDSESGQKKKP